MSSALLRGVALGLWILTGLAFLVGALFPGSAGARFLGPSLLFLAMLATVLSPGETDSRLSQTKPSSRPALFILTILLVLGISLAIVRDGDRRSFLFVAFAAVLALVLSTYTPRR